MPQRYDEVLSDIKEIGTEAFEEACNKRLKQKEDLPQWSETMVLEDVDI